MAWRLRDHLCDERNRMRINPTSALIMRGGTAVVVDTGISNRLCSDDGGCMVHLADIVQTRSHTKGPWNRVYDLDALRTMEVKADYLGRAVAANGVCRSLTTIEC